MFRRLALILLATLVALPAMAGTTVTKAFDAKTTTGRSSWIPTQVVTVETGKVNGAAATGITFTSAAIGDSVTLKAYQGIWYIVATRGTITLA